MRSGTWPRIWAVVFVAMGWTGIAAAAPATAIFPFEIYDTSGEAPRPDLGERLAMATRVLSEVLEKTGRFSPVDLGPLSAEVAATAAGEPTSARPACPLPGRPAARSTCPPRQG